jgi:predicted permease
VILSIFLVVLPVFLVTGAGYAAARSNLFAPSAVDGLMFFAQRFGIPCVLFRGVSGLDLERAFDPGLLLSFYGGVVIVFLLGILGARTLFGRRPGEAVAIGFSAMFSNLVLLALPITERAYGPDELAALFAIASIHAPVLYLVGITVMEVSRADGRGAADTARAIGRAIFSNALMIGIALGFAVNLGGITVPEPLLVAVDMIADAALPAALFGLGGVLSRYAIRASLAEAGMITVLSLVVHPAIVLMLATLVFDLSEPFLRAAVLGSAMAPGVNTYIFASMYGRAQAEAASAVLIGTLLSAGTVSIWLAALGGIG